MRRPRPGPLRPPPSGVSLPPGSSPRAARATVGADSEPVGRDSPPPLSESRAGGPVGGWARGPVTVFCAPPRGASAATRPPGGARGCPRRPRGLEIDQRQRAAAVCFEGAKVPDPTHAAGRSCRDQTWSSGQGAAQGAARALEIGEPERGRAPRFPGAAPVNARTQEEAIEAMECYIVDYITSA